MKRFPSWQSYRQVATQTAAPGQLVLMLFDGAILFLERSLVGFSLDDPLEHNLTVNNNILRAQAIVNELNLSLDMPRGGEFSRNMRGLYDYMDRRLTESNRQKDPGGIKEVIGRLTVLRDAWAQMLQNEASNQAVAGEPLLLRA
jgi:flagellar secretion chaperone FliS